MRESGHETREKMREYIKYVITVLWAMSALLWVHAGNELYIWHLRTKFSLLRFTDRSQTSDSMLKSSKQRAMH